MAIRIDAKPILASARRAFFQDAALVPALDVRIEDRSVVLRVFVREPHAIEPPLLAARDAVRADLPDANVELELVRSDPSWDCLFEAQNLLLGPVTFHLVRKDDPELRATIAAGALAAARMLDGARLIGRLAAGWWIEKLLDEATPALPPHEGFSPLVVDGDTLRVAYARHGWTSAYEVGTVSCPIAELPVAYLPRDRAHAVRFLRAIADLGAALANDCHRRETEPGDRTCTYCSGRFPPLEFHAHLGACHGCAESRLGVVH